MKSDGRWFTHLLGSGANAASIPPPRFADASLPEHYPPDLELEPTHLDIDLYISLNARAVGGRVTTTVQARRAGPSLLQLDAVDFEDLFVQATDGAALTWHYDGKKLTIRWEQPFAAAEVRHVEIAYRISEPASGLYFCRPDDHYPAQPWYAASDHETERARHWLPCIDLPNVRTTLAYHLRADARFTILANGFLESEQEHGDGTKTAHWRLDQPCPSYLACIAIGDFVRADDGVFDGGQAGVPIAYFSSLEHAPQDLLRTFGRTRPMLAWMTQLLDLPFPYPKYYQFALPGIGGAMENISLVSWSDSVVQSEEMRPELEWWVDLVNVHEMAHSYFGDAIVCRDFAHAWLKESWATYIEQCWGDHTGGRDAAAYLFYLQAQHYFRETERYQRPIITRRYQSSWDLYDAHLYEGGACRLHTLRCELGDDLFWAATRDYLKRYYGQVVETDDFRAVMEEHSGRSLGKFFDQWFRTPGFPDLKVSFEYDEQRHEGTFTVEQKQVDREKGIPAFELTTEVEWSVGDETARRRIRLNEPRHIFTFPMPAKPARVRFDPDCRVLHRLEFNPGASMLRSQLLNDPNVVGRILAAQTLLKTSTRANIESVVDAFEQEPFWGARCEFAAALGKADHQTAIHGLARLIQAEQEPRVLVALLRAAAAYRDAGLLRAVEERLQTGLRPLARQAAYIALGAQRHQAPLALLTAAAGQPTPDGRVQAGAFQALGETRQLDALPILQTKAAYGGSPNRARPAAVTALAALGKSQERATRDAVAEQLIDLLRDPWPPVAWAAARGLAALAAPAAADALDAFGRALSAQERAEVDRLVAALRQEDKLDGSAVKKEVEELRDKLRKLEDQVQTLSARLDAGAPALNS